MGLSALNQALDAAAYRAKDDELPFGVTEQTFYRWRKEYGDMRVDQAKRLKELEAENARLKRAVADLTVDKQILKEVVEGKY